MHRRSSRQATLTWAPRQSPPACRPPHHSSSRGQGHGSSGGPLWRGARCARSPGAGRRLEAQLHAKGTMVQCGLCALTTRKCTHACVCALVPVFASLCGHPHACVPMFCVGTIGGGLCGWRGTGSPPHQGLRGRVVAAVVHPPGLQVWAHPPQTGCCALRTNGIAMPQARSACTGHWRTARLACRIASAQPQAYPGDASSLRTPLPIS